MDAQYDLQMTLNRTPKLSPKLLKNNSTASSKVDPDTQKIGPGLGCEMDHKTTKQVAQKDVKQNDEMGIGQDGPKTIG